MTQPFEVRPRLTDAEKILYINRLAESIAAHKIARQFTEAFEVERQANVSALLAAQMEGVLGL